MGTKSNLSIEDWEERLVNRYLTIESSGNATPLSSFEVSKAALWEITKEVGITSPEAAEQAFRHSLRRDPMLFRALQLGEHRPSSPQQPNFFAYLAMTLFVDGLMDGPYSINADFRDRLATWLGVSPRKLVHLGGVSKMWIELHAWLESFSGAATNLRQLNLPDPGHFTQIGHTRRLAFPNWSDLRTLRKAIGKRADLTEKPAVLLRHLEHSGFLDIASYGLSRAFFDFQVAYRQGRAFVEHPFWALVLRATKERSLPKLVDEPTIELCFDIDGYPSLVVEGGGIVVFESSDLAAVLGISEVLNSKAALRAIRDGLLFFEQVGSATWRAVSKISAETFAVLVAFRPDMRPGLDEFNETIKLGESWRLFENAMTGTTILAQPDKFGIDSNEEGGFFEVYLTEGIAIHGGLLGLQDFLPSVQIGASNLTASAHCVPPLEASLTISDNRLCSDCDIQGAVSIDVAQDGQVVWRKRFNFVADCPPRAHRSSWADKQAVIHEWAACSAAAFQSVAPVTLSWEPEPLHQDLLEAIYGKAESHIDEPEILRLISRTRPGTICKWQILRAIQEGGVLVARRRSSWRGRIWTLPNASLVEVDPRLCIVEGALCRLLVREFKQTVLSLGGTPFRRLGVSHWSPSVLGAVDVCPQTLSSVLSWPLKKDYPVPRLDSLELVKSKLVATDHNEASRWDWQSGRFTRSPISERQSVTIARLIHPGGRDHDVYRLSDGRTKINYESRSNSILHAHILAQKPMFRFEDDLMTRLPRDGYLPLEIARVLRITALRCGGPTCTGDYRYPLSHGALEKLVRVFPKLIANARVETLSKSLFRKQEFRRNLWLNGRLETRKC